MRRIKRWHTGRVPIIGGSLDGEVRSVESRNVADIRPLQHPVPKDPCIDSDFFKNTISPDMVAYEMEVYHVSAIATYNQMFYILSPDMHFSDATKAVCALCRAFDSER